MILSSVAALLVGITACRLPRARAIGPHGVARGPCPALSPDHEERAVRAAAPAPLDDRDPPVDAALLIEHLAVDSPALRAAVARSLGHVATARALDVLVGLLDDDSLDVRVAAAEALGASGPLDLVAPLSARAAAARSAPFKRAAREAVARIQARHGGDPGRLSLTAPDRAGGLTLAAAWRGQSVADPSPASARAVTAAPSASTIWRP